MEYRKLSNTTTDKENLYLDFLSYTIDTIVKNPQNCQHGDSLLSHIIKGLEYKELGIKKIISATIISLCCKNYAKDVQININKYKEALNEYKILLQKTTFLANELNLKNSLEFSNLFTYLLWNGYFSKNKYLEYNMNNKNIIEGLEAFDIINGKGVCLNFSSMLKDFLNISGFQSVTLINNFDKNAKTNYIPKAKKNVAKNKVNTKTFNMLTTPLSNKIGNHVFNLILENNKFYIYDSTNFLLLELKNVNTAKVINGRGRFVLKPYYSYYLNCFDNENKILNQFNHTNDFNSPYNRGDYIYTWEKCIELFKANEYLFRDYYISSKKNIDAISKYLSLQKKR